jgi:thiamine biosynthesis lipoprotein
MIPFIQRLRPALGTFVEITAETDQPQAQIERAIAAAYQDIAQVESLMSFHAIDSELSRLNRTRSPITVHPWTARVLHLAKKITFESDHRFNPTVGGALVALGKLPDHGVDFISIGSADDLELLGCRVRRRRAVLITLDGIAKGFAVDRAIARLRQLGINQAVVNAGGDWRCFGQPQPIQLAKELGGEHLGSIQNGACATSAAGLDPERFPAQLIAQQNPLTHGYWTVIAPQAWRADALTKVAGASAPDQAAAWVQKLGGRLLSSNNAGTDALPHPSHRLAFHAG